MAQTDWNDTRPGSERLLKTPAARPLLETVPCHGGWFAVIGTGPDRMIHALDKDTGQTLWETEMDANPDGIPAIYEVAGREYIAFYGAVDSDKETSP